MLVPTQQIDMLNGQLVATQQQVTTLQDRNTELTIQYNNIVQELVALKGFVFNHEQVLGYVVNAILGDYDARKQRRQSRFTFPGATTELAGPASVTAADSMQTIFEDESPPSPLLHASKLLAETNVDALINNRNLEHGHSLLTSPGPDLNGRASTASAPPSAGSSITRFTELDGLVYPVGQTNGIDPMYSDHVNNIPYTIPVSKPEPAMQGVPTTMRKQALPDPGWLRQPQILLVEDDPMCRKIGQKFLSAFHCNITTAV
jgi:osomolarity two-component system, response regulator SKN7